MQRRDERRERGSQPPIICADAVQAVDIAGRTDSVRDAIERNSFAVESAVAVLEGQGMRTLSDKGVRTDQEYIITCTFEVKHGSS